MADPYLGQVAATVFENVVGEKPEDNIFTSQALLYIMKQGKGFRKLDGGQLIEESIQYAENSSFKSYGELETLDTTRYDVFDAARFEWKQVGGTITFSTLEKERAKGREAKIALVTEKVNNGKSSMFAVMNRMFYGDGSGNGGKDIAGLGLLVPQTTNTGSPGGISRAIFSWWRSYSASAAKTSTIYDNLRSAMRTAYNTQSRGAYAEHPDYIVFDTTTFGGYEGTLIANERFTDKSSGEGGFKNEVLKFKGAKVLFDEDCPNATGFVLNSANLKFNYLQFAKASPSIEPANQFAEVVKVLTIGNMSINNSRRLGRLYSTQS